MDIRRTSQREIYRLDKREYKAIYNDLAQRWGDNATLPIAQIKYGRGTFIWFHDKSGWKSAVNASALKQVEINDALEALRQEVTQQLGTDTTQFIFTYPDYSYVYYREVPGMPLQIILTGWGFKKPGNVIVPPSHEKLPGNNRNPVSVAFIYDGKPLPNYPFGLRLTRQVKPCVTNADGTYTFCDIKPGERHTLVDTQTGRTYDLNVVSGQNCYEFDVTTYATITLHSTYNDEPLVAESAIVEYHGQSYSLTTDTQGDASVSVPFHSGAVVSASMRDQMQRATLIDDNLCITFAFADPTPEEPEVPEVPKEPDIIEEPPIDEPEPRHLTFTLIDFNGQPFTCQALQLRQAETILVGEPDENGQVCYPGGELAWDQPVEVTFVNPIRPHDPLTISLDEGEYDYTLHEQPERTYKPRLWQDILVACIAAVACMLIYQHLLTHLIYALRQIP